MIDVTDRQAHQSVEDGWYLPRIGDIPSTFRPYHLWFHLKTGLLAGDRAVRPY
ncbi:hypothetical protein [Agrobacterium tumefaciens]|uniref:hypothetical protein n=1 Tax=Agrobacterium tumefaciens TaxID=358 RepID=UPI001571A412|nr:hypothetical protein [Agrobacterium tumefaciens]NTD11296.1 hypothetical protein [Agrobacterium tumefaciens]